MINKKNIRERKKYIIGHTTTHDCLISDGAHAYTILTRVDIYNANNNGGMYQRNDDEMDGGKKKETQIKSVS